MTPRLDPAFRLDKISLENKETRGEGNTNFSLGSLSFSSLFSSFFSLQTIEIFTRRSIKFHLYVSPFHPFPLVFLFAAELSF